MSDGPSPPGHSTTVWSDPALEGRRGNSAFARTGRQTTACSSLQIKGAAQLSPNLAVWRLGAGRCPLPRDSQLPTPRHPVSATPSAHASTTRVIASDCWQREQLLTSACSTGARPALTWLSRAHASLSASRSSLVSTLVPTATCTSVRASKALGARDLRRSKASMGSPHFISWGTARSNRARATWGSGGRSSRQRTGGRRRCLTSMAGIGTTPTYLSGIEQLMVRRVCCLEQRHDVAGEEDEVPDVEAGLEGEGVHEETEKPGDGDGGHVHAEAVQMSCGVNGSGCPSPHRRRSRSTDQAPFTSTRAHNHTSRCLA